METHYIDKSQLLDGDDKGKFQNILMETNIEISQNMLKEQTHVAYCFGKLLALSTHHYILLTAECKILS